MDAPVGPEESPQEATLKPLPKKQIVVGKTAVELSPLTSVSEMRRLEELQRRIWGYGLPDTDFPHPARALFALSESGGLVAGARIGEQVVGFATGWVGLGSRPGSYHLHSQLLGVLPEFRHLGIGYHLKLYQREFALLRGLDLVRWTFDPLQSPNANLNLRKLGAVVLHYHPDYYGDLPSILVRGLPTDRVWAEWHVTSARVAGRLARPRPRTAERPLPTIATRVETEKGWKRLSSYRLDVDGDEVALEIPEDFRGLAEHRPEWAREWRLGLRTLFRSYLSAGYIGADFIFQPGEGSRGYYRLSRAPLTVVLGSE